MLTVLEQERLSANMCVYEHEWRYLASYLGEPFLLDDILAFFDGSVLHINAFSLERMRPISAAEIASRLDAVHDCWKPHLIHLWGNTVAPDEFKLGGRRFACSTRAELKYPGEHTIVLAQCGEYSKEAKKAIRSFERDGLKTIVSTPARLSWRHLTLIETWRDRIRPGSASTVAGASIANYVRAERPHVVECVKDGELVGFSVFSRPKPERAVNLMSFSERLPGVRIDDSLLFATVEFCKEREIETIHLGYAGNAMLARFKEKWGARKTGADYTQAIYSADQRWDSLAKKFSFFWWSRLLESASADPSS